MIKINKGRRFELKMLHFKKRLISHGYTLADSKNPNYNLNAFRTSGKPCSCWMCKSKKFTRKLKHKYKLDLENGKS